MVKKEKILLKQSTDKQFEETVKTSEKVLKEIEKEINKIESVLSKLDGQSRFFVSDALIGIILTMSKLPPYILGSIATKYSFLSQIPYLGLNQKTKVDPTQMRYIG